jgi:predicted ArsR family transcriptional regulator
MGRERDEESGKYTDAYSDKEFIEAIEGEGGLAGTGEIATVVGCSHRQALNRLNELEERGKVTSKDVGRSLVWRLD